ncbi:1,2-dihydroxy-3-keto-5-methylthiopentene dioxygenase [Sphingobium chlorophenolicum]|uniref:Acireductone dioxygenase n=1 Tax=Sphingobium chlorophenolicum TaxID=46429 RepID=A0A081R8A6_SPHCR|nr:cupin [Sphingobium chlorophenolicum]KEQ51429.1 Acireductone dioxygenase (Ni(2+)-requiring) [Sphingobium chlorophenolicum]
MTRLSRYDDKAPFAERGTLDDFNAIVAAMAEAGVTLERWDAGATLPADARDGDILAAYASDIDRLNRRGGYKSCDVMRLAPDHPDRAALRGKFLAEHVHDDDEVRFFVEGGGLFYIRANGTVHALECTAGDLILLPAGTTHWFDMGEHPRFTAIRLFVTPEGWVARFTGDPIAESIPLYDGAAA